MDQGVEALTCSKQQRGHEHCASPSAFSNPLQALLPSQLEWDMRVGMVEKPLLTSTATPAHHSNRKLLGAVSSRHLQWALGTSPPLCPGESASFCSSNFLLGRKELVWDLLCFSQAKQCCLTPGHCLLHHRAPETQALCGTADLNPCGHQAAHQCPGAAVQDGPELRGLANALAWPGSTGRVDGALPLCKASSDTLSLQAAHTDREWFYCSHPVPTQTEFVIIFLKQHNIRATPQSLAAFPSS